MLDRKTIENLYWVFNDPSKLHFTSDDEELKFWAREEVCEYATDMSRIAGIDYGMRESEVLSTLWAGSVHMVFEGPGDPVDPGTRYFGYRLRKEFSQHSQRVREISNRIWSQKLTKRAA